MSAKPRFQKRVDEAKRLIREITVAQLVAHETVADRKPLLIDVRETEEFSAGHVDGAVHLSRGILEGSIETLVPDSATPVVLYCASGNRSAFAAESLQSMGYTDVVSLLGGYAAWIKAGLPIKVP